jgi:hypothetical protein
VIPAGHISRRVTIEDFSTHMPFTWYCSRSSLVQNLMSLAEGFSPLIVFFMFTEPIYCLISVTKVQYITKSLFLNDFSYSSVAQLLFLVVRKTIGFIFYRDSLNVNRLNIQQEGTTAKVIKGVIFTWGSLTLSPHSLIMQTLNICGTFRFSSRNHHLKFMG